MLRVLVVDDNRFMASITCSQLQTHGYEVVGVAVNGVEAVRLCESARPDVVLMDIHMPEMNGIEATTQQIMLKMPTCVIMMSAYSHHCYKTAAKRAGATAYLVKPIEEQQLVETIEQAWKEFQQAKGRGEK